jgi:hypothetical protein
MTERSAIFQNNQDSWIAGLVLDSDPHKVDGSEAAMKVEELDQAVERLWNVLDEVLAVHDALEDDAGGLNHELMEHKFSVADIALEDLIVCVNVAARRFAKGRPLWAGTKGTVQ